jgi:hypothetical protein
MLRRFLSSQTTQISIESVTDTQLAKKVKLVEAVEFAIAGGRERLETPTNS